MLLKSWSTPRMSSLKVCSRELPGYLMTSTKDQDMVLMMHSSMQSRKDIFSTSRALFQIAERYFLEQIHRNVLLGFGGLVVIFFFQSQYVECTHQVHLVNFDISLVVAYCRLLSYCFLQVPKALEKESSELTCFYPSLSLSLCVCELFKSSNWIWCGEILKHWWIICFKCKRNVITNTREISIATDEPVTFLTEEVALILVCLSEFAWS